MSSEHTPWGPSQHEKQIGKGVSITGYVTAGHGGWKLDALTHSQLQRKFKFNTFAGGSWYEEDCDVCAVVIAFPLEFSTSQVMKAVEAAKVFKGWDERDGKDDGNWHRVVAFCLKDDRIKMLVSEHAVPVESV